MRQPVQRIRTAALTAVCAASLGLLTLVVIVPRLVDGAALTVLSGSMTPTIPVGSLLVVRPVEPADVDPGDVITYANAGGQSLTTHRVVNIENTDDGRRFTTKGDANKGNDADPVPAAAVRGRVWFSVPHLGRLRDLIMTPVGLGLLIAGALVVGLSDQIKTRFSRWSRTGGAETPEVAPNGPPPAPRLNPPDGDRRESPVPVVAARVAHEPGERVEQQVLLVRLAAGALERGQVLELVGLLRAHVVALTSLEMIVSVVGTNDELDGAERLLRPYGIVESARSEVVSIGGQPEPGTAAESSLVLPYAPAARPVADLELLVRPVSQNGHSR